MCSNDKEIFFSFDCLQFWNYYTLGVTVLFDKYGYTDEISITAPNESATAKGNRVGSTMESVAKEFGAPIRKLEYEFLGEVSYHYAGISFEFDEDSKVVDIHIF